MRKYYLSALCLTAGLLAGCSSAVGQSDGTASAETTAPVETAAIPETTPAAVSDPSEQTDGEEPEGRIRIEKSEDTGEPEQMALHTALSISDGEEEWEFRVYAQEDMVVDGELFLDDRCRFQIRAVSDTGVYVLFDETVQLGVPAGDVWTDTEGRLHVVIREAQSARYRITDYVYDEESETFLGETVLDGEGINYWGTV